MIFLVFSIRGFAGIFHTWFGSSGLVSFIDISVVVCCRSCVIDLKRTVINDINELSSEVVFDWEFYGGLCYMIFFGEFS